MGGDRINVNRAPGQGDDAADAGGARFRAFAGQGVRLGGM